MKIGLVATAIVAALAASLATLLVVKGVSPVPATGNAPPATDQEPLQQPQIASSAAPALPVASSDTALNPGPSSSAMGHGGDEVARIRAESAALDREFRAQPRDAAWASKTEQRLRETMRSDVMVATEIVPSGLDYSCRTNLCLVKAEFAKNGDAQDWGIMLITASGKTFAHARPIVMALPNGKTELQLYAARH